MQKIDYDQLLQHIFNETRCLNAEGNVADYIPALANEHPDRFGMLVHTFDNKVYSIGDAYYPFSIQSIAKVFSFALSYCSLGGRIWMRMGNEPSGNAFNSLVQLEYENGKPRNPFINAGALVVIDTLFDLYENPKQEFLKYMQILSQNPNIEYDEDIAESEREHGERNTSLAWFMKSFNNIHNPVNEVLDTYFYFCSLRMSAADLARSFLVFANHGQDPFTKQDFFTMSQAKRISALLLTCGLYDESGDFAFKVGIPAKSGVGGGIVGHIPEKLAIATYSPRINKFGNSVEGKLALEIFTTETALSIF